MLSFPMRLTIISFMSFICIYTYWYLHSRHYHLTIPEEIKRHAKRAGMKENLCNVEAVIFFFFHYLPLCCCLSVLYFFAMNWYKTGKKEGKNFNHRQMVNKSCSVIMNRANSVNENLANITTWMQVDFHVWMLSFAALPY